MIQYIYHTILNDNDHNKLTNFFHLNIHHIQFFLINANRNYTYVLLILKNIQVFLILKQLKLLLLHLINLQHFISLI